MDTAAVQSAPNPDATRELLLRLWQRSLPLLQNRLSILDRAAAAAQTQTLSPDLHAQALADAHKLAGSLGMFGYPEGSRLAREIEQLLESSNTPGPDRLTTLTTALRAALFPSSK